MLTSGRWQQAGFSRPVDRFGARAGREFAEEIPHMKINGPDGDPQRGGDRRVALASRQEGAHIPLARCQHDRDIRRAPGQERLQRRATIEAPLVRRA